MRTAFIQELIIHARWHPEIFLIVGDLGYSVVEPFSEEFPDRFLNAGVAEQNMAGMAAGLAQEGYHVFIYSIGNFPTLRCLEQLRNDVCYHNLRVTVAAVGGGFAYGNLGYSHHAVEDLAIMRTLPRMSVIAPGDPVETRAVVSLLMQNKGPAYLRLGKAGEPKVHDQIDLHWGGVLHVQSGQHVTLCSTGGVLVSAMQAADALRKQGIEADVFSCPFISPLDPAPLLASLRCTRRVVTVEEHGVGGLASVVAEMIALAGLNVSLTPCRIEGGPRAEIGSQGYLRRQYGLAPEQIVATILSALRA